MYLIYLEQNKINLKCKLSQSLSWWWQKRCKEQQSWLLYRYEKYPRRPASADRTAHRQFQATGQPVSQTQASDAMTSGLPLYEAKCVQRRCFQCESVPLRSDIKGTELAPANILISPELRSVAPLQAAASSFCLYMSFFCSYTASFTSNLVLSCSSLRQDYIGQPFLVAF